MSLQSDTEESSGHLGAETDRYGFLLGNGDTHSQSSDELCPQLVRHREMKWLGLMNQWDQVLEKKTSKIKGQCQKGIPASVRAKCWPLLCGATHRKEKNTDLYVTLDSAPGQQSWIDIIKRDTDRQFPLHEMFLDKDGLGQQSLLRVLKAYTQFRPEEGYCQAQGPVAAVLLMNMPMEEAFWCLVQICELYLPGYYSPLLEGVLFDAAILSGVLKRACPAAHKHLQSQGVEPLMFATDWLMCLYSRHLPFNTLLRVWDLFFCHGVRVLFQVAVVLVRRCLGEARLRKECEGQMETLERLRAVRSRVQHEPADAFIQEVCSVSLSSGELQKHTEREMERWRKERPDSTFDPRNRCHGYHMVWERKREREKENERKERQSGNLSVPLMRSHSTLSLSPALLRKKWRKRGSKAEAEEWEGGGGGGLRISPGLKEESSDGEQRRRSVCGMAGEKTTNNEKDHSKLRNISAVEMSSSSELSDFSVPVFEEEENDTHNPPQEVPPTKQETEPFPTIKDEDLLTKTVQQETKLQKATSQTQDSIQIQEETQRADESQQDEVTQTPCDQRKEETQQSCCEKEKEIDIRNNKKDIEMHINIIKHEQPEEEILIKRCTEKNKVKTPGKKQEEETQQDSGAPEKEIQTCREKQDEEIQQNSSKHEKEMEVNNSEPEAEIELRSKQEEENRTFIYNEEKIQTECLVCEQDVMEAQEDKQGNNENQQTQRCEEQEEVQTHKQEEGDAQKEEDTDELLCETKREVETQEEELSEEVEEKLEITDTGEPGGRVTREEVREEVKSSHHAGDGMLSSTCLDLPVEQVVEVERFASTELPAQTEVVSSQDGSSEHFPQEKASNEEISHVVQSDKLKLEHEEVDQTSGSDYPELQQPIENNPVLTQSSSQTNTKPAKPPTSSSSSNPLRRSSSSQSSYPTILSEDTFRDPQQSQQTSHQAQTQTTTTETLSTSTHTPESDTQKQTHTSEPDTHKQQTHTPEPDTHKQQMHTPEPDTHKQQTHTPEPDTHKQQTPDKQQTHTPQLYTHKQQTPDTHKQQTHTPEPETHKQTQASEPDTHKQQTPDKHKQETHTPEPDTHKQQTPDKDKQQTHTLEPDKQQTHTPESDTHKQTHTAEPDTHKQQTPDTHKQQTPDKHKQQTHTPEPETHKQQTHTPEPDTHKQQTHTPQPDTHKQQTHTPEPDTHKHTHTPEPNTHKQLTPDNHKQQTHTPEPETHKQQTHTPEPDTHKQQTHTPEPDTHKQQTHTPEPDTHKQQTPDKHKQQTHTPQPDTHKQQTHNPQPDTHKRKGLFHRLRGQPSPKSPLPKILIQDFSEGEEKLSSKERRRRRREQERREKEEEKERKKREKELEKERERERKKPQTRGKSFQVLSRKSEDNEIGLNSSHSLRSKRNSVPHSESYF